MTSGIYRLTFEDGSTYIGKSINIEKRWEEHTKSMLQNKAAAKMQAAYKRCGLPRGEIMLTMHPDHIDIIEAYLIAHLQPDLNTSVASCMDKADFDNLISDPMFLAESTAHHVSRLIVQRKNIEALEYEVENLLEGYEVPQYHKEELWHAQARMHDAQNELKLFKRLPWYKRIFI